MFLYYLLFKIYQLRHHTLKMLECLNCQKTFGSSDRRHSIKWNSLLIMALDYFNSRETCLHIKLVQSKALVIILGTTYTSYEHAIEQINLERLETRRTNLCHTFAMKCVKSDRHRSMISTNMNFRPNMRKPKPYQEHTCNTSSYYNSTIPYLARLLNTKSLTRPLRISKLWNKQLSLDARRHLVFYFQCFHGMNGVWYGVCVYHACNLT